MKQVRSSFSFLILGQALPPLTWSAFSRIFLPHQGYGNWIGLAICQSMLRTAAAFRGSKRSKGVAHFRFTLPIPTVFGLDSNVADFIRRMHLPVR
jgi:hypothetical protein